MAAFGMHLGTAFQLIDDVLDYSADEAETGKHLGDDLAEGKPTLPLIHVMNHGTSEQAAVVRHAIEEGVGEDFAAVLDAIKNSGRSRKPGAMPRQKRIWRSKRCRASRFQFQKLAATIVGSLQLPGLSSRACSERGIAQPGRALRSGRRGRRFESSSPTSIPTKSHSSEWLFVCRSAIGSRQP